MLGVAIAKDISFEHEAIDINKDNNGNFLQMLLLYGFERDSVLYLRFWYKREIFLSGAYLVHSIW